MHQAAAAHDGVDPPGSGRRRQQHHNLLQRHANPLFPPRNAQKTTTPSPTRHRHPTPRPAEGGTGIQRPQDDAVEGRVGLAVAAAVTDVSVAALALLSGVFAAFLPNRNPGQ
ncbi:hypothetical protein GCM10010176_004600 [Nonomuraea spiralis]|nr:hypothetical protein GCM10010176_004600 [Nonomuraea spiralis]